MQGGDQRLDLGTEVLAKFFAFVKTETCEREGHSKASRGQDPTVNSSCGVQTQAMTGALKLPCAPKGFTDFARWEEGSG